MSAAPAPDSTAPEAQLEALRRSGGWRADPVRFRYLESLAARTGAQPEPVRRILQARLHDGLRAYAAHAEAAAPPPRRRAPGKPDDTPLAVLNRTLREARPDVELASARRFRSAWDAQRALEKLERALAQKPLQPGPLNSHALLLQSLELMGGLSPQYLRQFVLHVETLLWLADSSKPVKSGKSAGVARTRQKK